MSHITEGQFHVPDFSSEVLGLPHIFFLYNFCGIVLYLKFPPVKQLISTVTAKEIDLFDVEVIAFKVQYFYCPFGIEFERNTKAFSFRGRLR